MKQLLFMFLLLLALPTVAQDVEKTDDPCIAYHFDNRYMYVVVTGVGELTVEVVKDSEIVALTTCSAPYESVFELDNSEHLFEIGATAQAPGMEVSNYVYQSVVAPTVLQLIPPTLNIAEDDDGVTFTLTAQFQMSVSITVNGELMTDVPAHPSSPFVYRVERSYDEDKLIEITTSDCSPEGITSETACYPYVLEQKVRPTTPKPTVRFDEDESGVDIVAEGEGNIFLFVNGEEVGNPCFVPRTGEDQTLEVMAYATMPDYYDSEVFEETYFLRHWDTPPVLRTEMPSMFYEVPGGSTYGILKICPAEPSVLYYRIGHARYDDNGLLFWEYDETREYTGPLMLDLAGDYYVVAYAIAEGKLPSNECAMTIPSMPYPSQVLYDFEEAGIFYKITGEDEVSVCAESLEYGSYSGEVVIPATVAHDGVTYRVTKIADNAFKECTGLTRVTIGDLVTEIGANAFDGCSSLTTLTLPDYVITVGNNAFANCTSLTSLTLGFGLSNIGDNAFSGCSALATVTCKAATPPMLGNPYSFDCYDQATLRVHPAVVDSYRSAGLWCAFRNIVDEYNVAPVTGDADGDGRLSARDVATLINMLLNAK